jgi:hypothetical protein
MYFMLIISFHIGAFDSFLWISTIMASTTSGIAKMILQYDWILEDVEKLPMTYATKMIFFRGEKFFRLGLKNYAKMPVLFFIAVNLEKIGLKVVSVSYALKKSRQMAGPENMWMMKEEEIGHGPIQLFNVNLAKQISSKTTFVFLICIEGTIPGYSNILSDRLAKDQLWDAVKSKNWIDVEFVVKGKTFSAHKAILASRF